MDEGRLPELATNEDLDLVVELDNPSTDLPEDLTGFAVWFYLKSDLDVPDADAELAIQGTLLDQVAYKGQALFPIPSADMVPLREGMYWWSVNAIEPGGRKTMVKRDKVKVVQNPNSGA